MSFSDSYLTIEKESEGLFKDKGSKFLAFIYPVNNELEIKQLLQHLKLQHHSARHHCYAWRLGSAKMIDKVSDDGEPYNTAGKPILGKIQSHELSNVLIVVVRYFGGTLLGTSGLVNAYKSAAEAAIQNSVIIKKHLEVEYQLFFSFTQMNDVMNLLKNHAAKIISRNFDALCEIRFYIRKKSAPEFEDRVEKMNSLKLKFVKTL